MNKKISMSFLFFICGYAAAHQLPDLEKIFRDADFHPSVPSKFGIQSAYGKGLSQSFEGVEYEIYELAEGRQLRVTYDDGKTSRYSFATEVSICQCKFQNNAPLAKKPVHVNSLLGVGIGDLSGALFKKNRMYRKKTIWVGGKNISAFEMNPVAQDSDLFVRYMVDKGRVIGFSVGVTE